MTTTFKVVIGTQSFYLLNEVIGKQENYYSEVYSKSDKYDVVNRLWLPVFKHRGIIEPQEHIVKSKFMRGLRCRKKKQARQDQPYLP